MDETAKPDTATTLKNAVNDILENIEQEREREIITRRFGLFDRRETLEQIGELLGITRERVRQLEKAILIRLKIAAEENKIPAVNNVERVLIRDLSEAGRVARVQDLAERLVGEKGGPRSRAHIAFIAELSPCGGRHSLYPFQCLSPLRDHRCAGTARSHCGIARWLQRGSAQSSEGSSVGLASRYSD